MACVRVASMTLKIAVLPPMPTVSARTATTAKPGDRRRLRMASLTSVLRLSKRARTFIRARGVKWRAADDREKRPDCVYSLTRGIPTVRLWDRARPLSHMSRFIFCFVTLTVVVVCVAGGTGRAADADLSALQQRVDRLEVVTGRVEAISAIKRLQHAYGH